MMSSKYIHSQLQRLATAFWQKVEQKKFNQIEYIFFIQNSVVNDTVDKNYKDL